MGPNSTCSILPQLPERDDENVRLFRQGRDMLKQALIDAARQAGSKPKPAEIDRQIAAVERQAAALAAVEGVEAAGGTAVYRSLDLRDCAAVQAVIDDIRAAYGRIDLLVHAAGLLVDKTLPEKQPEQFDLVFDVKADGFFNLLKSSQGMPIGATVAFSSVAGRFGNNGQADYSAANDLLCKTDQQPSALAAGNARNRDRLDRLGRHRHGCARLGAADHGGARRRHAAAGGRASRRSAAS